MRNRGFTLLELLTALLITGMVMTVALPAWQAHGFRIERTAALTRLQRAAECQAQRSLWVTATTSEPDVDCLPRDSSAYRFLAVQTGGVESGAYEWRAEPQGRQRGDACGTLVLDHRGRRTVLGTAERALPCWQGR
jgi:type IV pilus assembly protein PilE